MELLRKYWYIVVGLLLAVVYFFFFKKGKNRKRKKRRGNKRIAKYRGSKRSGYRLNPFGKKVRRGSSQNY